MGRALACVTNKAKKQSAELEQRIAELETKLAEAEDRAAAYQAQLIHETNCAAVYKAVLEGFEFEHVEYFKHLSPPQGYAIGAQAKKAVKYIIAQRDVLKRHLSHAMSIISGSEKKPLSIIPGEKTEKPTYH